jgi:hypothetical protein
MIGGVERAGISEYPQRHTAIVAAGARSRFAERMAVKADNIMQALFGLDRADYRHIA